MRDDFPTFALYQFKFASPSVHFAEVTRVTCSLGVFNTLCKL